ncbi:NB-ARC domain-containing protein [Amycolatopsis sp. NPDC058278]|uniref:NB-ARC domain-containing protein n=1 Tax=Amycolatopsis sp. NPDC058278 TaxID=3346417 RepID=UPI0036D9BD49
MSKKLKHFVLTLCLIGLSAVGALLGGLEDKTWWVLAGTGAVGVVLQTLTTRVGNAVGSPTSAASTTPAALPLRQLPSSLPDFVGRTRELSQLRSASTGQGAADIRLVFGPGGVGKTSLVVQAVEQESERFPDGQLYVDLQGYGPNALPPEQVLVGWLRDLGLDERVIPTTLTERSREFRSRMAGKRAAVILDNADTEQQVRPLMVGGVNCVTYVTSRSPLGSLPTSMRIQLDGLSVDESVELLGRILGSDRVRTEEQPAHQLASASVGLPLALRVLAGRLVTEPRPLAALVNRLDRRRAEGRLLAEFTFGDLSVEASLALSREHLLLRAQEAFDMLGLHPADDWPDWSVAALWGCTLLEAEEILESLTGAQLVKVVTAGSNGDIRYRMHDLVPRQGTLTW